MCRDSLFQDQIAAPEIARQVRKPASTAITANTGFLDFLRKYEAKKVAGTTLETPSPSPIIVMLSPYVGLARKNSMSGVLPKELWPHISALLFPSMTDCNRYEAGKGEDLSRKLTMVPSRTRNEEASVSQ